MRRLRCWSFVVILITCQGAVLANPLWTTRVPRHPSRYPMPMGLAVANNGAVVAAYDKYPGWLYSLDAKTGKVRWTQRSRADWFYGPAFSPKADRIVVKDSRGLKPATELTAERLAMMDIKGRRLWNRKAQGAPVMSPSGRTILMYDPENDFGVSLRRASDGRLLWTAPSGKIGPTGQVAFSPDGTRILVRGERRVSMLDTAGNRIWQSGYSVGIPSAATSNRGERTAILQETGLHNLVVVRGDEAVIANTPLRRNASDKSPKIVRIDLWHDVQISANGGLVVVRGFTGEKPCLQARNAHGRLLWERAFSDPGNTLWFEMLPNGVVALTSNTLTFLDRSGKAIRSESLRARSSGTWALSPNGAHLAVQSGPTIQTFVVPAALTRPVVYFTYYENGLTQRPLDDLRPSEEWSKKGGHMPWRMDPVGVAQSIGAQWLGLPGDAKNAEFRLISKRGNSARVRVYRNGQRIGVLDLRRPLGYWWYVTSKEEPP